MIPDEVDGCHELAQSLQRVVLALERDEDRPGRRERVHRQESEARRTVDEDVVVVLGQRGEYAGEAALPLWQWRKLHLGAGEGERGGNELEAGDGGADDQLLWRRRVA